MKEQLKFTSLRNLTLLPWTPCNQTRIIGFELLVIQNTSLIKITKANKFKYFRNVLFNTKICSTFHISQHPLDCLYIIMDQSNSLKQKKLNNQRMVFSKVDTFTSNHFSRIFLINYLAPPYLRNKTSMSICNGDK